MNQQRSAPASGGPAGAQGPLAESLRWRWLGILVWHGCLFGVALLSWVVALSPFASDRHWIISGSTYAMLYGVHVAALSAHRGVLSVSEAPPLFISKLGLHGRTWVSALLSRVVLRGRTLADVAAVGSLYGLCFLSATVTLYVAPRLLLGRSAAALGWSLSAGAVLSFTYVTQHLLRCQDVLTHPHIQRQRYFRVKRCLPQVLVSSAHTCALALALALLVGMRPPSAAVAAAALPTSLLCVYLWSLGSALLQIVLSERAVLAQPGEVDPNRPLLEGLGSQSAIARDLALEDLALMSEDRSAHGYARRAALFADETGRAAWGPVVGSVLQEARGFVGTLATALPSLSGEAVASTKPGSAPRVQWNAVTMASAAGARQMSREQDTAAWAVRSRGQSQWWLRVLSGLAASSRAEDRYGVVLLCDPSLGDMLTCLASSVLALQQYGRLVSSQSSRSSSVVARALSRVGALLGGAPHPTQRPVELQAHALEEEARRALSAVCQAFGSPSSLQAALREARLKPAFGAVTDVAALVEAVAALRE